MNLLQKLHIAWIRQQRKRMFSGKSQADIFTKIYRENLWKNAESRSGPGSTLQATTTLRPALQTLFHEFSIHSIADVGCGDFGWMQTILPPEMEYTGLDIVPELVRQNQEQYGNDHIRFLSLDICTEAPPLSQLIICRDVWVHLPEEAIQAAVMHIRRSGTTYLLATTFPRAENKATYAGGWRPVNLQARPYYFPPSLAAIEEQPGKEMRLWRVEELVAPQTIV